MGSLQVLGAALLWSTAGLFIKEVTVPAAVVVVCRSLLMAVLYLVVLRPRLGRARPFTVIAYAGMVTTFIVANKWTTAANAVFLEYTGPIYVVALGPVLLGERLERRDLAAIGAGFAGLALFFVGRVHADLHAGDVVAAASGLFFAGTIIGLRRDAQVGSAVPSMVLGSLLSAAVALPWAWHAMGPALSFRNAAILGYLGIVQMGVAYLLFTRGLQHTPAAMAGFLSMAEPVLNPVWVYLGTGERPAGRALLGGALVLGTVILRLRRSARFEVGTA